MSLVYAGALSHAPGITGRAHLVENTALRDEFYAALEKMGIEICAGGEVERIEEGEPGLAPRHVVFADGAELHGDVVMPFYGLVPNVDFMSGAGVDMERGILVDSHLKSSTDAIWGTEWSSNPFSSTYVGTGTSGRVGVGVGPCVGFGEGPCVVPGVGSG